MSRAIDKEHVSIWEWLQCMDINPSVIDRREEREEKDKICNDRWYYDNSKGRERHAGYGYYEPYIKKYLLMNIYKDRTVLTCYNSMKELRRLYGSKYTIYTDGAHYYNQVCRWLRIRHHVYDQEDKNVMERSIQYIKDRTECVMITFHTKITAIENMLWTGLEYSWHTLMLRSV
jgi:putative transposase